MVAPHENYFFVVGVQAISVAYMVVRKAPILIAEVLKKKNNARDIKQLICYCVQKLFFLL